MSWLASNPDAVSCPHCGASLRRGMLRCRECGGAAEDDFQLAEQVSAEAYTPQCEKCGSALGDDGEECAKCASAMLDELLSSAPTEAAPQGAGRRSRQLDELQASASSESRLRPGTSGSSAERDVVREEKSRPEGRRQRRTSNNADTSMQKKGKSGRGGRRSVDDDAMDFLTAPAEPGSEPDPQPQSQFTRFAQTDTTPESSAPSSPDAAGQAAAALILSLSSTDANLRCQAATALGQLGVSDSISALEPLMADPEIQVRRAVAEALIQLGHPKGESLLAIAERKPAIAKEPPRPRSSKPRKSLSLPRFSFNFMSFDHESLVSAGGPIAGVVLILGGVFLWHSGLLFGPRLDESYRPIKPFYAFWMADPAPPASPAAPKTAEIHGAEMNF